jgi:thiamine pyrophosphate-dependent acetolactate synthase large subunit-like protein
MVAVWTGLMDHQRAVVLRLTKLWWFATPIGSPARVAQRYPGDVALQPASDAPLPKLAGLLPPQPVSAPAAADLDRLAALLNGDGRVTILRGSGCAGAHDELLALGERLKTPMAMRCAARSMSNGTIPTMSA